MDRYQALTMMQIMTQEQILQSHHLFGSEPVSFAKLKRFMVEEQIEEGLNEGLSSGSIAIKIGVCERTVERFKKKWLAEHGKIFNHEK